MPRIDLDTEYHGRKAHLGKLQTTNRGRIERVIGYCPNLKHKILVTQEEIDDSATLFFRYESKLAYKRILAHRKELSTMFVFRSEIKLCLCPCEKHPVTAPIEDARRFYLRYSSVSRPVKRNLLVNVGIMKPLRAYIDKKVKEREHARLKLVRISEMESLLTEGSV